MTVGVVYRGGKELDGVIAKMGEMSLTEIIIEMLCSSKHLGQIRLIMLDEDLPEPVHAERLWEQTGKPVLIPLGDVVFDSRYMLEYRGRMFLAAGIDEESARRVLDEIYGDSRCEALRIAGIILRSIPILHNV